MDAFTENWGEVFGLFVPPVILVPRVLKQIQEQGHVVFRSFSFGPLVFLASFMHGPEGIYQANYRLDGSVHFKRFLYALNVWSGVFWYRRPLFFIESELSRFINLSCIRITFQLGQCCQDHIFVYGDNYKGCYLITFCFNKSWEKTASMC